MIKFCGNKNFMCHMRLFCDLCDAFTVVDSKQLEELDSMLERKHSEHKLDTWDLMTRSKVGALLYIRQQSHISLHTCSRGE